MAWPAEPSSSIIVEWQNVLYLPSAWEWAFTAAQEKVRLHDIPVHDTLSVIGASPHLIVLAYPAASHYLDEVSKAVTELCDRQSKAPWLRVGIAACGEAEPPLLQTDVSKLVPIASGPIRRHAERCRAPEDLGDEVERWINLTAGIILARNGPPARQTYDSEELIARNSQPKEKEWMGWY
jgi:hypothetical protein